MRSKKAIKGRIKALKVLLDKPNLQIDKQIVLQAKIRALKWVLAGEE